MKTEIKGTIVRDDDAWVYDLYGYENTPPSKIAKVIEESNRKNEPLDVYVSSDGGFLDAGIDIYTMLKSYGRVNFTVARASSAASVIICAGKSQISPAGYVMIHNVSGVAQGDYREMEHTAEILKTMNRVIAEAYTEKTGLKEAEFLSKMNAETYLTASEAVAIGLCDEILSDSLVIPQAIEGLPLTAAESAAIIPQRIVERMKRTEAQAKAKLSLLKLR